MASARPTGRARVRGGLPWRRGSAVGKKEANATAWGPRRREIWIGMDSGVLCGVMRTGGGGPG